MPPDAALPKLPSALPASAARQERALTPAPPAQSPSVTSPALTPVPAALAALAASVHATPTARASGPTGVPLGKVKGTLLLSRMKYLRARGDEDCERVLRRMSAADQQVLRGMLLPSSWYDAGLVLRLETTIVALLSRGERRELFLDMGRFTADTNLGPSGVQRPYLSRGDPHHLLRNVPRMYASQHAGGVRTYEPLDANGAVIRTIEGEEASAEDCLTAVGWLKRAVELSGGKLVTVEELSCRGRGHVACEYVCRWI